MLGTAWCESAAGDPARAVALLDEVASLVADPDDTVVAQMAATELGPLIRLGRFAECEAVAERGAAAARRAGRPDIAYMIWTQAACALSAAGDLTGALRAADAGVAAARGITVIELPRGWPAPRHWPAAAARTRRTPSCAGRPWSRYAAATSRGRWCRGWRGCRA